jgi:nucleoid-associated protein YgaU
VIAFIINGLPNLQRTQAEVTTNSNTINMGRAPDLGIGGIAQTQANHDWNTLVGEQEPAQTADETVEQVAPAVETPASQPEVANNQNIRYETSLPTTETPLPRIGNPLDRIENLLERLTAGQQNHREQTVATVNLDTPAPAAEPTAVIERQPAVQPPQTRTEVRPAETVARNPEQPRPAGGTPARSAASIKPLKIYVVGEGESLSTVAKNVYGPEEGNRYVNINRIYEANKDVLKSVHEVVAGQKLVIPALPKPTVNPNRPSDVLPRELFERLEPLRKPAAAQTPAPSGAMRWYTVQDGDNLWKIARNQLGAGARYEEIAKLNGDILKEGVNLGPGMKIRLPLK